MWKQIYVKPWHCNDFDSFEMPFLMFVIQVIEAQVDMPIVGAITLYVSLLTFTLRVHPDRLDYVDQVLVWFFLSW